MKICPNCGAQVEDSAAFCTYCGTSVATFSENTQGAFSGGAQYQSAPQYQSASQNVAQFQPQMEAQQMQTAAQPQTVKGFDPNAYNAYETAMRSAAPTYEYHNNPAATYQRDAGMVTAIKVFLVLGCINSFFWGFIPLFWRIPMTVHAFKKLDNNEAMSTGFKVCSLIFVNGIAGILMFIIKDEDMPYER